MSGVIFMSEEESTDTTDTPRHVDAAESAPIVESVDSPKLNPLLRHVDAAESAPIVESVDSPKLNPLLCYLCNEQYREPCILQCFHSYCTACLVSKTHDGKVICPLCGSTTVIKDASCGPPADPLLQFLVESSSSDRVQCANCDAMESQMYFCNTCSQPLCLACREETHRPRMFSQHEIVLLSKHTREIQRQCKTHGEPYILFSTEKKLMLCINCFRDMKVESRSHCVDMETAYKQGCQKLDNTMQSIRDLQHSVRDAILLLKALLGEVEQNAEREKVDITALYNTMQEKISETKLSLLKEIERQYEEKRCLFKEQLVSLSTFLPTLHVHLVTCAAFSSSANRFEFLDLTYVLMERLKCIIQVQHPLHPSQGSEVVTDYKAKFAKCLEPLLFPHRSNSNNVPASKAASMSTTRLDSAPVVTASVSSRLGSGGSVVYTQAHAGGRRYSHNLAKVKVIEDTGFFADHCKQFDDSHRTLMQSVERLKTGVQELQRDLTLRRCLAKEAAMGELKTKISTTEDLLDTHYTAVEQKQSALETHWEKCLDRIAGEQEVYKAQLQDVTRLKSETQSVKTILQRLSSFVSSIANVTERIAPKLGSQDENQHAALLHDINTVTPDSQHRVDAIRTAQEEREKAANRTNPLDEELIKTKGLLRAPSERKDPSRRDSREIKEVVSEEEGDAMKKGPGCNTNGDNPDAGSEAKQGETKDKKLEGTGKAAVNDDSIKHSEESVKAVKTVEMDVSVNENALLCAKDVDVSDNDVDNPSGNCTVSENKNKENLRSQTVSDIDTAMHIDNVDVKTEHINVNTQSSNATCLSSASNPHPCLPDIMINACQENIDDKCPAATESDESVGNSNEELSAEFTIKLDLSDTDVGKEASIKELEAANGEIGDNKDSDGNDRLTNLPDEIGDENVKKPSSPKSEGMETSVTNDKVLKTNNGRKSDAINVDHSKSQPSESKSVESNTVPRNAVGTLDRNNESGAINNTEEGAIDQSVEVSVAEGDEIEAVSPTPNGATEVSPKGCDNNNADLGRVNEFVLFDNNNPIKRLKPVEKMEKSEVRCNVDDDDEEYVTKSLPELAQVFQPGELIKKKQRTKSDSSKSPQDPAK